jgi:heme-degrading monooxygenase HmoA
MAMVVTMLEAEVAPERAGDLENAFARETAGPTPPGLVRSFLLHGPTWRIATVWESREALEAMRSSGETPAGVRMFREAGAEPALSVFEVVAEFIAG